MIMGKIRAIVKRADEAVGHMTNISDALEAAEKRIDGLQKLVDINTERCEALRKQLRESHENYERHIAILEAKIPKESEWIWDSDTGTYLCSECNATSPREDQDGEYIDCPNYCPNCGSRMRKGEQE
jgi:DNA-directed RNA polymerase subunit RPC12/RpoP